MGKLVRKYRGLAVAAVEQVLRDGGEALGLGELVQLQPESLRVNTSIKLTTARGIITTYYRRSEWTTC